MRQSAELYVFYQNSNSLHQWLENIESIVVIGAVCSALVVLVCCYQKRNNRHCDANYSRLENSTGRPEGEEEELYTGCQPALSYCMQYLKNCGKGYKLVRALPPLGTRPDKHWFTIREARRDVQRILVMSPLAETLPKHASPDNLLNLLHYTAHPYIHPVLHVGFHNGYLITVVPINTAGSLRDLLHQAHWARSVEHKYVNRGQPLPLPQVQRLSRQLLEALVWLKQCGLPTCRHIHTGNIIVQGGVARLAGLENSLICQKSDIPGVEIENCDTLCFAHVLFEMCSGYRLHSAKPSPGQLLDLHAYPQVIDVLEIIFNAGDGKLPAIETLLVCDLFRNIDLRELQDLAQSTRVISKEGQLTGGALALLREVTSLDDGRNCLKRQQWRGERINIREIIDTITYEIITLSTKVLPNRLSDKLYLQNN